jgi:hypothetical protein
MFVWEVITDLSATYRLVADAPFALPTLAYVLSRYEISYSFFFVFKEEAKMDVE